MTAAQRTSDQPRPVTFPTTDAERRQSAAIQTCRARSPMARARITSGTRSAPADPKRTSAHPHLGHHPQLAAQVGDLVAQPGGVLEAQVLGGLVHLLLEVGDQPD